MPVVLHLAVQQASAQAAPDRRRVRRWVSAALAIVDRRPSIESVVLTVRFVDRDEARALNRSFRGRDYATNVLTFPYESAPRTIEADVVVCLPVVADEALAQAKDPLAHCAHLVVHGTLHAAGYDHEEPGEAEAMEALERVALTRFRIADPYATA